MLSPQALVALDILRRNRHTSSARLRRVLATACMYEPIQLDNARLILRHRALIVSRGISRNYRRAA